MRPVTALLVLMVSVGAVAGCSRIESWRANRAFDEGVRLAQERKSAEALAKFDEAIDLQHDHLPARLARAKALQDLKRHDEAIAEFDLVIRVDPQSVAALEGRGVSKEARQIGSGLDDLNAALRASGTTSSQIPLIVSGVPNMLMGNSQPGQAGGGSQAEAVLKGTSPVPKLGSYFRDALERERKARKSPLRELMNKMAPPPPKSAPPVINRDLPLDLDPILDWANMTEKELDEQDEAMDRLIAETDKAFSRLDGIADFLKAGKKDPTKPATSLEWSFTFDAQAFLADFYNLPLVAYFPGSTGWKAGLKELGSLIPVANKAYFYFAHPEYESTRGEVAHTTQLFGITSQPTLVVVRLKSPVLGGPKTEHLETQIKCEARPMRECGQQVLNWLRAQR